MARIIIVWGLWGPYHCRRFEALRDQAARNGHHVTGVSLFSGSRDYQWLSGSLPAGVTHFELGKDETKFPLGNIGCLLAIPRKLRAEIALLPSYFNWSLALNAASRLFGSRVVMMNDSHAGTARARGMKAAFKQKVVARFHAGFVAGEPQRRYFASLGLPAEKIFTGYDAVDNDYFAQRAKEIRSRESEVRGQYDLPEHYFLSLGRFVAKKNLSILMHAYRKFLDVNPATQTHLVMVGSGEEGPRLLALGAELRLPVYDKTAMKSGTTDHRPPTTDPNPGVHFYGFRQIDESPIFYALADAFVLPSLYEEWGLVVNEAMACGLPLAVSVTAGCAEDLLEPPAAGEGNFSSLVAPAGWTAPQPKIRRNGFVFDPQSSTELSGALTLLSSSPEMRAGMGEASRRIVQRFSCENFAKNALSAARASLGRS